MDYKVGYTQGNGFYVTDGTIHLANGMSKEDAEDIANELNQKEKQIQKYSLLLADVLEVIKPMVKDWTNCPSCCGGWQEHDYGCRLEKLYKRIKTID